MDLKAKGKKKNTAISGTVGGMVWEQFGAMYRRRSESAFLLQRSVLERLPFVASFLLGARVWQSRVLAVSLL